MKSRPRTAAVFALNPLPSNRAHVGAIVGMTNAIQERGFKTTLYSFRTKGARSSLIDTVGLHENVRLGWSCPGLSKLAKIASVVAWMAIAAWRRHDIVMTRSPVVAFAARRTQFVFLELHQAPKTRWLSMRFDHRIIPMLRNDRYRFLFISHQLRTLYMGQFENLLAARCVTVPSGFRRDWYPEEWSPSLGHRIITYAGSLYEGRGIDIVIAIAKQIPDSQFRVVGGSAAEWRRLTAEIDVPRNCTHIPHLAPNLIPKLLTDSDILLAPYQLRVLTASGDDIASEISPLKIVEYLAAGRAIVASDLPAIRELITDSSQAILVAPDDVFAWTESVRALLADKAVRDRLGVEAFRRAHGRLDWDSRLSHIPAFRGQVFP